MRAGISPVVLLLAGCATGQWQVGADMHQRGDTAGAIRVWENCAANGEHMCMALLGAAYEEGRLPSQNTKADAVRWYTLAARHGNGWARTRLTTLGEPVPQADLTGAAPPDMSGQIGETLGTIFRRLRR